MARAYSYLRFSTPEQAKGDSHRRQSELARDYAGRNGLDLDDALTFHDLGVSAFRGANAETGRLGDFRQAVEQGLVPKGSYLLVESLDRISRQAARKALRVLEDIADAGVVVVTLNDGRAYDSESLDSDPTSLLIALITFIRSNEESETKSRRLKAAWSNKRAKASTKVISARGPAWLRLADDRSSWQVVEDRADVVRRIFAMAATGTGEHAIATSLNRDSVPTFGDNGRAPATMWRKSYVSKILQSEAAIGTLVPHVVTHDSGRKARKAEAPVPGYYPAIVSGELWGAVRALKETASPLRGRHAAKPVQNVLGGLARCAACGAAMTRVYKGPAARQGAPKLVCTSAKTGAGCDYRPMPLDAVEDALKAGFDTLANGGPNADLAETSKAVAKEKQDRVEEIESIIARMFKGDTMIKESDAWIILDRLLKEKAELCEEVTRLGSMWSMLGEPAVAKRLAELERALAADPVDRTAINLALRQMFSRVVVDVRAGTLGFSWKTGDVTTLPVAVCSTSEKLSAHAKSLRRTATGRYLRLVA